LQEAKLDTIAVSINDAARALGLGRTSIYSLINEGKLEARKLGRRTLVTTVSIRLLIDGAAIVGGKP
jgi:excisionase family DNA binding protein